MYLSKEPAEIFERASDDQAKGLERLEQLRVEASASAIAQAQARILAEKGGSYEE